MPDPDFSEALLLEQYQAQISSALTPAFGADSSSDLASAAVKVCATFITTGLVTDIDRMGRILKLLVAALESFASKSSPIFDCVYHANTSQLIPRRRQSAIYVD